METTPHDETSATRMLFMGEAELAVGFQLLGFEVWVEPEESEMDRVLKQIIDQRQKAFVILGDRWANSQSAVLRRVRNEGGRIVLTEVPPLHAPNRFHHEIDDRIGRMFARSDDQGE